MDHAYLTGIIFALGFATVALSGYACVKFNTFRKKLSRHAQLLSRAVSYQLAGEAVIGLGTLVFATAEFMGVLSEWNYHVTSALRFTMFFATAATTWHLVCVVEALGKDGQS